MANYRANILANTISRAVSVVIGFAFIPVYIRYLGVESYGLVGFSVTLQAAFSILDLGLGTTMNREMACRSSVPGEARNMRDLTRSLETIYWLSGLVIGGGVALAAPVIAGRWLNESALSTAAVEQAVRLMGLWLLLQWPSTLYNGGLMGLQKQVQASSVSAVAATVRAAGAWLVLSQVAPTIQAFFTWQVVVSLLTTLALGAMHWRCLPPAPERPSFSLPLLRSIWRFAAGMTSIAVITVVLSQLDRAMISAMLPLKTLGYYTLAVTAGAAVNHISSPVFNALFPGFSTMAARAEKAELAALYHRACRLMTVLIVPPSAVIAVFARQVMYAWTGSADTAIRTAPMATLLAIGYCCGGLMNLPYALQLAFGWTRLAFCMNAVSAIVLVPAMYAMISAKGAVGAAAVWLALNAGYVLVIPHIMHTKILEGEKWRWYARDVGRPAAAAVAAVLIARPLIPPQGPRWLLALELAVVWLVSVALAALAAFLTGKDKRSGDER